MGQSPSNRKNPLQTRLEHELCLQVGRPPVKHPRVSNILLLTAMFAAGAALAWIVMWSRRAAQSQSALGRPRPRMRGWRPELALEKAARPEPSAAGRPRASGRTSPRRRRGRRRGSPSSAPPTNASRRNFPSFRRRRCARTATTSSSLPSSPSPSSTRSLPAT